jgi:hypothetical protein
VAAEAVFSGMTRYCASVSSAVLATVLPLAACNLDVREREAGGKDVDITTPIGNVSVRTNVESPDTGLAVYPGSRPLRDGKESESAAVNVGSSFFDVNVIAAKFESTDAREEVIGFYRNELRSYGEVTECRGDLDFRNQGGARRRVCREKLFADDFQLAAGPENQQHIVSVKPRSTGTEFALVYVQTRGTN